MIALFSCFVDSFVSVMFICIKYPLLILGLYMTAITLLVSCMILCTICCIAPLVVCWICTFAFIFKKLTCCCKTQKDHSQSRFNQTIHQIGIGLAAIGVVYLFHCILLVFAFLFLHEDGPPAVTIYIKKSNNNQMTVFWLHVAAAALGAIFFIFGIFRSIFKDRQFSSATRTTPDSKAKGKHSRVGTNEKL